MFYQSVFIILGGLLSVSELLPFIDQTSANGVLDFLIHLFINQREEKKTLQTPLLNYNDDILKLTDYICKISNENKDELKTLILENSESLQKHLSKKMDFNQSEISYSQEVYSKLLNDQMLKMNKTQDYLNDFLDSIRKMEIDTNNTIQNLSIKADLNHENIQEILNKPCINNNDIIGICEMILQHLQELQRKYTTQNNILLETLNKFNGNKENAINHEYEQKITSLLHELTITQETVNTLIKNHSDESKNLEFINLLQTCLKNQEETNKHIQEICNLLNKKKKMNLFFNGHTTNTTSISGSSGGTNGS